MDFNKEKEYIWKKIAELSRNIDSIKEKLDDELVKLPDVTKDSAQASKKTSEYRNRAQEAKKQAEACRDDILDYQEKSASNFEDIENLKVEIVNVESSSKEILERLKANDLEVVGLSEGIKSNIENLESLNSEVEALKQSSEDISSYWEDSKASSERIRALLAKSLERKQEIDSLYEKVFGYEHVDEDGEQIHEAGLVDELDKAYKDLSTKTSQLWKYADEQKNKLDEDLEAIKANHQERFEEYLNRCNKTHADTLKDITDLMPKALTSGLASAYDGKVEDELIEKGRHKKTFIINIFILMLISLIPLCVNIFRIFKGENTIDVLKDTPYLLSAFLPLYLPSLWLAYFANKNYKLSKRLIEEYTHKGVISKTFEGVSRQINELDDELEVSKELKVKLLFSIVSANNENPGKLISDYNKSDHPLIDALDKSSQLADSVSKLAKIPGFSAMARKLDEKSNRILEAESRKIETTLGCMDERTERDSQSDKVTAGDK